MTKYYVKSQYDDFKENNNLDKEKVLDKIFAILDNSNEADSLDEYTIIEVFKKMNGRKYGVPISDEWAKNDVLEFGLVEFTGKENPAIQGNQKDGDSF